MIKLIIYLTGVFIFYYIAYNLNKELENEYYRDQYKKSGMNVYMSFFALFNPRQYLKDENLREGYSTLLFLEVVYLIGVLLMLLTLGELGVITPLFD